LLGSLAAYVDFAGRTHRFDVDSAEPQRSNSMPDWPLANPSFDRVAW
jgi:hypothetical protein